MEIIGIIIGLGLSIYGIISVVRPRSIWWITELSNISRGIKESKPNEYYEITTRIKGILSLFVGILMIMVIGASL